MAKETGKKKFLDFFKMKDSYDDDEFDDDLFDDDDDDDDDYDDYDDYEPKNKSKYSFGKNDQAASTRQTSSSRQTSYQGGASYQSHTTYRPSQQSSYASQARPQTSRNSGKLVEFNSRPQRQDMNRGGSEVYVIKPQGIGDSQTVADCLKSGKTIVINMEGHELTDAQRIIDFICGACYAIDGSLQAISANIFIAAPNSIEVSGDLREEILNESTVSPQLGIY